MNTMKDENVKLKTKISVIQQEMTKKDKDIQILSQKL